MRLRVMVRNPNCRDCLLVLRDYLLSQRGICRVSLAPAKRERVVSFSVDYSSSLISRAQIEALVRSRDFAIIKTYESHTKF